MSALKKVDETALRAFLAFESVFQSIAKRRIKLTVAEYAARENGETEAADLINRMMKQDRLNLQEMTRLKDYLNSKDLLENSIEMSMSEFLRGEKLPLVVSILATYVLTALNPALATGFIVGSLGLIVRGFQVFHSVTVAEVNKVAETGKKAPKASEKTEEKLKKKTKKKEKKEDPE
jgi:hypothetical protein